MCSSLFVIFSLVAVLGGTTAQTCSADSAGEFSGVSKAFPSTSISTPGSYIVPLPSLCISKARGVQVWACTRGGLPPSVTVRDYQNVQVDCPYGGCVVSAVGWCSYGDMQLRRGHIQTPSYHNALRSELLLPVQPILGGPLGNVLFRGR